MRSAIHPTVIVVSARKRAAKATFTGSPFVRAYSTLNLRAMTGECFGRFTYQYQELTPFLALSCGKRAVDPIVPNLF
jgi:hypothetical protein